MVYLLILVGVLFRLLYHLPNFSPIAAIALFGANYLDRKWSLLLPLLIMMISDVFLGLHETIFFTWGSFLLIGVIGLWIRKNRSTTKIVFGTLLSSVLFFIITNFGVWLVPHSLYPKTFGGLIQCYIMALPFFRSTLLGDLFYVGLFFGTYEVLTKKFPLPQRGEG